LHHANVRDAAVSAFAISPRSVTGRPRRRRQRNPKCEPGWADTRIHIAPPFCRTLTAYGVIKSPIYSSRARHQRRPRLIHEIAHSRALFYNYIYQRVFNRRDARRREMTREATRRCAEKRRTQMDERKWGKEKKDFLDRNMPRAQYDN